MSKSAGTILYDCIKRIEGGKKTFGTNTFANPMEFLNYVFRNHFGKEGEANFLYWLEKSKEGKSKRVMTNTPHSCPKRMLEPGPWERKDGLDDWEIRKEGGYRACTFCGSIHPEDLVKFCDKVDGLENYITRKGSIGPVAKLNLHDKSIKNATEGPIKFYTTHFRYVDEPVRSAYIRKVEAAMKLTNEKEEVRFKEVKDMIQKQLNEKEEEGGTGQGNNPDSSKA
jgi:hypothetical protein